MVTPFHIGYCASILSGCWWSRRLMMVAVAAANFVLLLIFFFFPNLVHHGCSVMNHLPLVLTYLLTYILSVIAY